MMEVDKCLTSGVPVYIIMRQTLICYKNKTTKAYKQTNENGMISLNNPFCLLSSEYDRLYQFVVMYKFQLIKQEGNEGNIMRMNSVRNNQTFEISMIL